MTAISGRRSRSLAAENPAAPRARVEARVLRVSAAPDLASISPYREALAVDELEVVRGIGGENLPRRIRRVRWAILDGRPLPAPAVGAVERIVLEPFAAQPQLQSLFFADDVGESAAPLWFELAATAEP